MTTTTNPHTDINVGNKEQIDELREKIISFDANWIIPGSGTIIHNLPDYAIDYFISLFTHQLNLKDIEHAKALELAKIEALRTAAQTMKAFDSYVVPGVNTGNALVDKESVINLLTKEN